MLLVVVPRLYTLVCPWASQSSTAVSPVRTWREGGRGRQEGGTG